MFFYVNSDLVIKLSDISFQEQLTFDENMSTLY
jgi:hypothetical protein